MAKKNTSNNLFQKGNFTGIYKGDNGNMLTATSMIYEVDGDEVEAQIDITFVQLYTHLYDQYRSFQSQNKDFFEEWDTVFEAMGRTYNTKKSKDQVKLLESCSLLKQIKMPVSNARIKIVADVSIKDIRFINRKYDASRAEQAANNAARQAEFEAFNAVKEEANKEAKGQLTKPVAPEPEEQPEPPKQQPEPEAKAEVDNSTAWFTHREKLIAGNAKWGDLSPTQKTHVMHKINSCSSSNFLLIKDRFDTEIACCLYVPPVKHEPVKPQKQASYLQPYLQTQNSYIDDEEDKDFIPF